MHLAPRLQKLQRINVLMQDCIILYSIVFQSEGKECRESQIQGTGKAFKTSGCFYLTVWNPANFVGVSSKSHIFSELLWEAGTCENLPIKALGGKKKKKKGKRLQSLKDRMT